MTAKSQSQSIFLRCVIIFYDVVVGRGLFRPQRPSRHPLRYMPAFGKGPRHHPWQERPKQSPGEECAGHHP